VKQRERTHDLHIKNLSHTPLLLSRMNPDRKSRNRTQSLDGHYLDNDDDDDDNDDIEEELKRPSSRSIDLNPAEFDPNLLSEIDDDPVCCPDDGGFERCCSHCWFLMTCLACYVYSSLLRLVVVLDFVVMLTLFIEHVMNEGSFVETEITHYDFAKSVIFVMLLSTVRNALLFICFAYQYQTYHSTFITATTLTAFSAVFLSIKLVFCIPETTALSMTLYSLCMSITSYFLYGCVRRRRISVPPRKKNVSTAAAAAASLRRYDYEKLPDTSMEEEDIEASIVSVPAPSYPRKRLESMPDGILPKSLADEHSSFVNFEGIVVHYRFTEAKIDPKKPALILLHGFGGSVFSWKKSWDRLQQQHKSSILAFDRPGFGLTSRPSAGEWEHNPYTQRYSLMLLFKLMDYLNIKRATFIGHGSGGALAVLAAAMRPKRVDMVVLISPAIFTSGFPTFIQSLFRTRLGKSIVTDLVRSEMGELLLRRSYFDKKNLTEDVLQTYKNLLKVQNWDEALLEMTRVQQGVKVESKLSLVECPIAIIHGGEDKLIPFSESRRLLATLERHGQRGKLRKIPKCGHVPHEELPKEFSKVVVSCLEEGSSMLDTRLEIVKSAKT